ncbi:MAG: DUF6712 family protein [Bacteroidales bacterium]
MLEKLLPNSATLRKYVNINASVQDTWWQPFVYDAGERYLQPYLSNELIEALTGEELPQENVDKWESLKGLMSRALAQFTVLIATDETSINVGGAGHTVTRNDNFAPASDTKILAYKQGLAERGWRSIEGMLAFLEANKDVFEWKNTNNFYLQNAKEFQDVGMVGIGYSRLTYEHLCDMMRKVECGDLLDILGIAFEAKLRANKAASADLLVLVQRYVAAKSAFYLLQEKTKRTYTPFDYEPILSLLPYDKQATRYEAAIVREVNANLSKYGLSEAIGGAMNWNAKDKKLFYAEG